MEGIFSRDPLTKKAQLQRLFQGVLERGRRFQVTAKQTGFLLWSFASFHANAIGMQASIRYPSLQEERKEAASVTWNWSQKWQQE